jgi:O-antigen ligase
MGFVLSLLYFVTYYLTPTVMFGPLAPYRIELILAILIIFVSLPKLAGSIILKTPQSVAVIGLVLAIILSVLIGMHWAGGTIQVFLAFIPNAFAFFLVCLHCNSMKKLQAIVLMLLFVCLFVIGHGCVDQRRGISAGGSPSSSEDANSAEPELWSRNHPYVLAMSSGTGEGIYRIRGLGEINDPNDFGQLIICTIPLMFIFWRAKKIFWNLALVILPVSVLLYGAFLTHSRGALVALMAVAVVAARRRIGTLPALLIAGGLFVGAMALHFTGGRAVSVNAGEDRTALWGESLQLLKAHPFFGVGFGNLTDYLGGQTSHNSVAVCAAELGMFGLFFWCLFLLPTVRDALVIASPAQVSEAEPVEPEEELLPLSARKIEVIDRAEVNHLGRLLVLSLTGFLVAGWFLSRSFVMTFFLLGGMVEVVYEMALRRGMVAPRLRLARVLPYAGILAVLLILVMYIMLRIVNMMH